VCRRWNTELNKVEEDTRRQLADVLSDLRRPWCSIYGSIVGLLAFGLKVSFYLIFTINGKGRTLDIAPLYEAAPSRKRSGTPCIVKGSHSFTCHPRINLSMSGVKDFVEPCDSMSSADLYFRSLARHQLTL